MFENKISSFARFAYSHWNCIGYCWNLLCLSTAVQLHISTKYRNENIYWFVNLWSRFENSYILHCTTKLNRKRETEREREWEKIQMNTSNAHKSLNSFLQPTKDLWKEKQNSPKKRSEKILWKEVFFTQSIIIELRMVSFFNMAEFQIYLSLNFCMRLLCLIIIQKHLTFVCIVYSMRIPLMKMP